MFKQILTILKHSPLPVFALTGLLSGLIAFALERHDIANWIWAATLILGGAPIVWQTLKGMVKGHFASDIVAMLAIITAVLLQEVFAGAIVVLMQSGGEAIEAYGLRRASSSLTALLKRAPRIARRKIGDGMEEIDVQKVKAGDILIVRPGDLVPVDGTITHGEAEIDDSALTGEPLAKARSEGSKLLSGSVNVSGIIEMQADRISKESQYAKIVMLVKKAQEEKAPIQRLADRYAIIFTPLTLIMSALGYLLTHDPTTILAVLVVATPCPLILATPLAVICGINRAADNGIIVKGGAPMEQVASAKAALFDKTGTITYGTPQVEEVVSLDGISTDEILYHAAIIDQFSSHSVAKAIVAKASEKFPKLTLPHRFQESPGKGVEGEIDGHVWLVGSRAFLEEHGAEVNHLNLTSSYYEKNRLLIFVAKDHRCIGCLTLSDKIRPGIPELIKRLYLLGVKEIAMLTGDSQKNAEVIAKQAGITNFRADLLPEEKVAMVQELSKHYQPLIMVGDGINDAPALATATVGIAMGAYGTAISAEAADIILLVDDLSKVADTIAIGKRMLYIAKQSIFIGIGLSFALMVIAAWGFIPPPVGAMLQEVIDVAVILNALRAR